MSFPYLQAGIAVVDTLKVLNQDETVRKVAQIFQLPEGNSATTINDQWFVRGQFSILCCRTDTGTNIFAPPSLGSLPPDSPWYRWEVNEVRAIPVIKAQGTFGPGLNDASVTGWNIIRGTSVDEDNPAVSKIMYVVCNSQTAWPGIPSFSVFM